MRPNRKANHAPALKSAFSAAASPGVLLKRRRATLLVPAAILALASSAGLVPARGQSTAANDATLKSQDSPKHLQFDVASIKPSSPNEDRTLFQYFPDGTSFRAAPVRMVLEMAFGVQDDHIVGAPLWVSTNRYDIQAKVAPEDATRLDKLEDADRRALLISLLTERFNLKYHHETRVRPTFALVIAKGGPRLTKGEPEPPEGFKPVRQEPGAPPQKEHYKIMTIPGRIEADSVPMYVLADQLTQLHALGRSVVDKTGLTGNYNFTLRWTPDSLPFHMMSDPDGLAAATQSEDSTDAAVSSLFTSIQEQLGLKLVPEKESVDVIVIDRIDPPSPN